MLSRRALIAASVAATALLGSLAIVIMLRTAPSQAQDSEGGDMSVADLATSGSSLPEKTMGQSTAPVTVIEYASMTCPHCARFNAEVFPQFKAKYIDSGHVYYILREFPLDPRATGGFMLARCASDDKYFAMVDVLFEQQKNWAFVEAKDVVPGLLQIAKQAGITQERFDACLKDKNIEAGINAVQNRAKTVFKVSGTPTFFVNGKRADGELSIEELDALVEPLLKK